MVVMCRVNDWSRNLPETGRPYHWVQRLCGLQFLADDPSKVSVALSRGHMSDTVKRLRSRVCDRLSLQKQLAAFGAFASCRDAFVVHYHMSAVTVHRSVYMNTLTDKDRLKICVSYLRMLLFVFLFSK